MSLAASREAGVAGAEAAGVAEGGVGGEDSADDGLGVLQLQDEAPVDVEASAPAAAPGGGGGGEKYRNTIYNNIFIYYFIHLYIYL